MELQMPRNISSVSSSTQSTSRSKVRTFFLIILYQQKNFAKFLFPFLLPLSQERNTFGLACMLVRTSKAVSMAYLVTHDWRYCGDGSESTIFLGSNWMPVFMRMDVMRRGITVASPANPHWGTKEAANPNIVSACLIPV